MTPGTARCTHVVIFGAGLGGARQWLALSTLPAIEVISFLDNDPGKHGTMQFGLPVRGIADLASMGYDYVIVASIHHRAIRAQLLAHRVPRRRILVVSPAGDARAELRARGVDLGAQIRLPEAPALRVAVCGAGTAGMQAWETLTPHGVEVVAFLDNDRRRWGTCFLGAPVGSPTDLDPVDVDFVLVASVHAEAITRQLLGLGIPPAKIATAAMLELLLASRALRECGPETSMDRSRAGVAEARFERADS